MSWVRATASVRWHAINNGVKEVAMLVLTRTAGQRLIIGDGEIVLSVLEVRSGQVRLGVTAPKHIAVHREEVYERIQSENSEQPDTEEQT